jgi:hypothetical protein
VTYLRGRDVLCTYCGADRGDLCRNGRGEEVSYFHKARDRRAASKRTIPESDYPAHPSRPLTVPCPVCEVQVGQECNRDAVTPSVRRFHAERYTAAIDTFLRQGRERARKQRAKPPDEHHCPSCGHELDQQGAA